MSDIIKKTELVGNLVRPSKYAAPVTKTLFKNGVYGLVIRADWDTENRILYIEILVGAKTFIEREYKSISQFWGFWDKQN